ncbi:hypothetical protein M0805_002205 [Coniferiporia weirii]|nr:hypothetical protein M0805_002205 [Coniferiporia weirii]
MATPSSSATSPSPALSFAMPASASEVSTDDPTDQELAEREERRKKILARTEFAKITRALRSTLALASYKARHNVVNVPLRSLEAEVAQRTTRSASQLSGQSSPLTFSPTHGADKKRKANTSLNNAGYSGSPLAQASSYNAGTIGLGGNGSSSIPSPELNYAHPSTGPGSGPANAARSLFASILSLPPAKRARTIHNPEAPPVPPPLPPSHAQAGHSNQKSPKKGTRKGKEPAARAVGKAAAKEGKGKDRAMKGAKGKGRANSISSTRTRSSYSGETENVNDTDIKAAATLTDLLFSRTGGTASPRSSFSAPTSASRMATASQGAIHTLPLSQTSSASSVSAAVPRGSAHARTGSNASTISTATGSFEKEGYAMHADVPMDTRRSVTPTITPRLVAHTAAGPSTGSNTNGPPVPVQRAADSEAADLMLLLANSPSPARPPVPRDYDITRNVYAAGRVLFPSSGNMHGSETGSVGSRALARGMGGSSFSSVMSNESGEGFAEGEMKGAGSASTSPPLARAKVSPRASEAIVAPPTPESANQRTHSTSARPLGSSTSLGQPFPSPPSPTQALPQTPAAPFNMGDYINISPSPAGPAPSHSQAQAAPNPISAFPPPSSSVFPSSQSSSLTASGTPGRLRSLVSVSSPLRKSFDRESLGIGVGGRKLFENEPGGAGAGGGGGGNGGSNAGRRMRFGEEGPGSLGSGIDLVQT